MNEQQSTTLDEDRPIPPPMCDAWLDDAELANLFDDLALCAEILSVQVKERPNVQVGESSTTLRNAARLLAAAEVRGVQVRYRYQSAEWCDTIVKVGARFRLVRVQQPARD